MLALGGAAKLRRPEPTVRALWAVRVAVGVWPVRALGALELVLGTACLVRPVPSSALAMAAMFLAFAGFVGLLVARGATGSCGCAGSRDVPPSLLHAALSLVAAGVASSAAAVGMPGLVPFAGALGYMGVAFVIGTAAVAYLTYLAVVFLPSAFFSYRRSSPRTREAPAHGFRMTGAAP